MSELLAGPAPLLGVIDGLCADVEPLLTDEQAIRSVRAARVALREPLRLAVVGRVSTGKSTLVNALVGRRVAPTKAGECTRVVTWYRFGAPDQAHLRLRDGTTRPLRMVNGSLPDELDVPAEEVDRLEVQLVSRALRELTLIDTPGLATLTESSESATRSAIFGESSQRAAGQADALLYLIGDAARRRDLEFLTDFAEMSGSASATSLNSIAVVAQADRFGAGPLDPADPFQIAAGLARRLAERHPAQLAEVIAVSGLLAEAARTGRISESVAGRLGALAADDPVLISLRTEEPALRDLFALFGPYGVASGRQHAQQGAVALQDWAESVCGIRALEQAVRSRLQRRAVVLKAARTMRLLDELASALDFPQQQAALDLIEAAELNPAAHPLAEASALSALLESGAKSPLIGELTALLDGMPVPELLEVPPGADPTALANAARERSGRATRAAAQTTNPHEATAGRTLARSYLLLARSFLDGR